jgi:hypothetical protein
MKTSLRKAATPRRLSAPRGNERRLVTHHARRRILSLAAGAVALPAVSRLAGAQTYPSRPITMIVPFAAGGPTDVFARIMAEAMKRSLGQPVIIENVSGADGSIGVGRAARARPDGYTIDLSNLSGHVRCRIGSDRHRTAGHWRPRAWCGSPGALRYRPLRSLEGVERLTPCSGR